VTSRFSGSNFDWINRAIFVQLKLGIVKLGCKWAILVGKNTNWNDEVLNEIMRVNLN